METELDYYTGFEGEMFYIFTISCREITYKLNIWSGYISEILSSIPLGENGFLEGLALHYTMYTGWYEEELWTMPIEEIAISIKQFEALSKAGIYKEPYELIEEIIEVLKQLFEKAYAEGGTITIEYT